MYFAIMQTAIWILLGTKVLYTVRHVITRPHLKKKTLRVAVPFPRGDLCPQIEWYKMCDHCCSMYVMQIKVIQACLV